MLSVTIPWGAFDCVVGFQLAYHRWEDGEEGGSVGSADRLDGEDEILSGEDGPPCWKTRRATAWPSGGPMRIGHDSGARRIPPCED
jgi:hypothetical protein